MSPVTKSLMAVIMLLAGLALLAGCGSEKNEDTPTFEGDQHSTDWLPAGHMVVARHNQAVCAECHGSDYGGGISGVSCTSCHLGGVNSVHPISWGTGTQIDLNHAPYVMSNGATACANIYCHGANLNGVTGPACSSCHLGGSPVTATGCTSCHGKPPSGMLAPNRSGAHAAHNALPNVINVCDTCHSNAGTGTLNHDNGVVDLAFLNAYNAKGGVAVRNADGTCSNISCHGGQTTPGWSSGTSIDIATQCTLCHTYGTAAFNSFLSGKHAYHVDTEGIDCVTCHDTSKLGLSSNHFKYLDTAVIEGPASATLNSTLHYSGGSCSPGCHLAKPW